MNRPKKDYFAFVFMLFLIALSGPSLAGAEPESFVIRTQYRNPSTQKWQQETIWHFTAQSDHQYAVFRNDEEQPVMLLSYSDEGRLVGVRDLVSGAAGRDMGVQNAITLSWGFPVPFDDLYPDGPGQQVETIHKQIGDTRFAYQITKETSSISFEDALLQGMLSQRQQADYHGSPLKLITVRQDQDILVRQLWEAGAGWWWYEETDMRRSWREP